MQHATSQPVDVKTDLDDASLQELLGVNTDDEKAIRKAITVLIRENETLHIRNDYLERDIERVSRYLDQLQHDVSAIEHSRAWKIGFGIVSLLKRLLGRKPSDPIFGNIRKQLDTYHHWKKSRG